MIVARCPDEANGIQYAMTVRQYGIIRGLRTASERYVAENHGAYPSPVRWAWVLWIAALFGTRSRGRSLLLPLSPLGAITARRLLPDGHVALATLAAVYGAHIGSAWLVAASLLTALSFREASGLIAPAVLSAWIMSGHSVWHGIAAISDAVTAWVAVTWALLGRNFPGTLRMALAGHDHEYTLREQRGAPHRLLVDLMLLSPVSTVLAVLGVQHAPWLAISTAALILAHIVSPVRNVRTVLAADIMLRILAGAALMHMSMFAYVPLTLLWLAADIYIYLRTRTVVDPVTSNLVCALGMPEPQEKT